MFFELDAKNYCVLVACRGSSRSPLMTSNELSCDLSCFFDFHPCSRKGCAICLMVDRTLERSSLVHSRCRPLALGAVCSDMAVCCQRRLFD